MTIVRSQIELRLADVHPNILRKDINRVVKIILSEITEALRRSEAVEIRSFGRFSAKTQKSRICRNPRTGSKIEVPLKQAIRWKCSKSLLNQLNKNFTENKISATN